MKPEAASPTDNWPQVRSEAERHLPDPIVTYIDEVKARDPHPESQLINVLHKVQEHFGYLGVEQQDAVAQLLGVPMAKVSGVATFYHFFRLTPRGRFMISVCMGTACYVRGAERVVDRFEQELGITFGETTTDGLFSLQASRCLGTCGLAPVVMINDDVHGKVGPDQVSALLDKYVRQARAEGAEPGGSDKHAIKEGQDRAQREGDRDQA